MNTMKPDEASYTVAGLSREDGHQVAGALQDRLNALNDLQLTLKHVHWNVVGPDFIGVHEMLDPQVDAVRLMVDATAERMATRLSPIGRGTTTPSGGPRPKSTWRHSTWCTPE
jgi:starvation-inducible DNA-binding protein